MNKVAERDPAGYWYVSQQIERFTQEAIRAGVERGTIPLVGPDGRRQLAGLSEAAASLWGDPPAAGFFDQPAFGFEYMHRWREHVPSARALWPLQITDAAQTPFDADVQLSEADRLFFNHVADAIGIRSRSAVMAAALRATMNGHRTLRWLSLASGAAVPVLHAASGLQSASLSVGIDLLDFDPGALELAKLIADEINLADQLTVQTADLFDLDALQREASLRHSYHMVDILGFFEYLPDESVSLGAGRRIPSASDFLRVAMQFAQPSGGTVVLSNMLDTHPQLDFVLRVVQWPYIQPRSISEISAMIEQAGVAKEKVTLLLPDDGVYAVAVIRT